MDIVELNTLFFEFRKVHDFIDTLSALGKYFIKFQDMYRVFESVGNGLNHSV